jgi:hypothetical protein
MPDIREGYMWGPLPEKEHLFNKHLFTKQLSKHSIGAYMELCREIGVSFEAVAQPRSDTGAGIEEVVKVKQSCFTPSSTFNILINSKNSKGLAIRCQFHLKNQRLASGKHQYDDRTRSLERASTSGLDGASTSGRAIETIAKGAVCRSNAY